ncbi:Uncharacterized protein DBV15_02788 [Temnothorax longispinosus]|uniref:acetate--CoA ligase n=1 Tax=Temnothorax longispinosus TaxID=300112 RepID=A0A4S2KG58_9HYME|nr:Uncharacterized protein DBV15_02788 [Temnothorax longispinosus]
MSSRMKNCIVRFYHLLLFVVLSPREGNDPEDYSRLTYRKLLEETCRFANVLKSKGVSNGDKVVIYMPMILELPIAMLACTRIGAVHSVVFAGYSSDSLADRVLDSKAKVLITADGVWRGEKLLLLKNICDEAADKVTKHGHRLESCIVVAHLRRLNNPQGKTKGVNGTSNGTAMEMANVSWDDDRDVWWHDEMEDAEASCYPVWMAAEDPLFILYTSGSTGKPKGVLHTTAGYLIYAATTFKYVFDYHPGDIYWCTADCGWITGHTYVVYGPLANGATSVIFEGTPFYPENDRYWSIIDKYKVTQFYTAPTAIRSLMKFGDHLVKKHNLSTLKVLGSVGEPINTEAWLWFYNLVGHGKCSIADTFWQTETGGHVITPLPGATPMKPGSAKMYYPNSELAREAHCGSMEQYKRMHESSIKDPTQFWGEIAKQFYWETPAIEDKFFSYNFDLSKGDIFIRWMEGASTNISFNLLDKNTFPFFGVLPELLDEDGRVIEGEGEGYLVFRRPWPGMMRTLYGNHQRFQNTYFDRFNGFYCTGDGARRDADGYLWVTGRIDDMLNVSGHLMSTAEVESVLAEHSSVAEAAVVSKSHPVKGQCLYCFITPTAGTTFDEKLQGELKRKVRERIGPFAQPDAIQHAPALPKTRSGKIMRRMLRKIAAGDRNIGDTSTLADETVIQLLFELRPCV